MISHDERETVLKVFRKLAAMDIQNPEWGPMDEQLWILSWLEDNQLVTEAEVKLFEHKQGEPRCTSDHPISECFVPVIVDAVVIILDLHRVTGYLHEKNKLILQYYLALSQVGYIRH